jgi:hypothetical protein
MHLYFAFTRILAYCMSNEIFFCLFVSVREIGCFNPWPKTGYNVWRSKNLKIKIFKTIISRVVLYECETWSLTLREEHILMVSREQGAEENI